MSTPAAPPAPKVMPYLTVIPGRHPTQKFHSSLGHAKNAIANAYYGYYRRGPASQLWDYTSGEPVLLYDIPAGTNKDDLPWRKDAAAEAAAAKARAAQAKEKARAIAVGKAAHMALEDIPFDSNPGVEEIYEIMGRAALGAVK